MLHSFSGFDAMKFELNQASDKKTSQTGVSFNGKSLKLNSEDDGKFHFNIIS